MRFRFLWLLALAWFVSVPYLYADSNPRKGSSYDNNLRPNKENFQKSLHFH